MDLAVFFISTILVHAMGNDNFTTTEEDYFIAEEFTTEEFSNASNSENTTRLQEEGPLIQVQQSTFTVQGNENDTEIAQNALP